MYNILLGALLALLMARRGRGRRGKFRRYLRGNVDEKMALGTLAPQTAVVQAFGETVSERTYVSSLIATWAMSEFTIAAGDGPIMVGVMHSDYSAAELEEFIENTGSWNEASLVQTKEIGRRLIRVVGIFRTPSISGAGSAVILNEGRPMRTKLGWILTTGQTLDVWAYNLGASGLATTDPQLLVQGHANLWPK